MKSVVRPELPTAAAGSSQAPTAPVDNSAPRSTHPEPTYKSGKTVQITGTTSVHGSLNHGNMNDRVGHFMKNRDLGKIRLSTASNKIVPKVLSDQYINVFIAFGVRSASAILKLGEASWGNMYSKFR